MKVKRFAQHTDHSKKEFWIEFENGSKDFVKDDEIQTLWFSWAQHPKAIRYIENDYLVFDYKDD